VVSPFLLRVAISRLLIVASVANRTEYAMFHLMSWLVEKRPIFVSTIDQVTSSAHAIIILDALNTVLSKSRHRQNSVASTTTNPYCSRHFISNFVYPSHSSLTTRMSCRLMISTENSYAIQTWMKVHAILAIFSECIILSNVLCALI
jgi:hypothetical protein